MIKGIKYKFQQLTLILQKYLNVIISFAALQLFCGYHYVQMLMCHRRVQYADKSCRESPFLLSISWKSRFILQDLNQITSRPKISIYGPQLKNQYSPFHKEQTTYISSNVFISSYFLINMFLSLQL